MAAGACSFALGTDTAGSGRVPAMMNNLVGIKPTPGLLSTRGLVPACRSLDCITVFALSVSDGIAVRRLAEGYDPADAYSRRSEPRALPASGLRIGVLAPADREFCGYDEGARLYEQAIAAAGETAVEIDYAPFREVAALLYDGPWTAEREEAFASFGLPDSVLDPSVAAIFAQGKRRTAVEAFAGLHRLEALRRSCEAELARADVLLLPSAPRTFTIAEMRAEPLARNAMLGLYTNFCNFLGMAAIAVPAGFDAHGLPFGVMLVGAGFTDDALAPLADRLHRAAGSGAGLDRAAVPPPLTEPLAPQPPVPERIEIAVVGAHLSGMPLNHELVSLGGTLAKRARTSAEYRLFVLPDTRPPKPGLLLAPGTCGPGVEIEVWSLPAEAFGRFVAAIPSPLGIGKIRLEGGGEVSGFLCESWALGQANEITELGSWRNYMAETAKT